MPLPRRYEKGERRFKHVGQGPVPEIEFDPHDPKKWVGKCPSTIPELTKSELLNAAIPEQNGDRELAVPKRLYVVHDGAIYEAMTSDHGWSYHAYPYRGKLSRRVLEALADMARRKDCAHEFEKWVKIHIERHGARR